jgi:hypothetical protein
MYIESLSESVFERKPVPDLGIAGGYRLARRKRVTTKSESPVLIPSEPKRLQHATSTFSRRGKLAIIA